MNFAELNNGCYEWNDEDLMGLSEIKSHTRQQLKPSAARKRLPAGTKKKPAAGSKQPVQKLHHKTKRERPVLYGKIAPQDKHKRAKIMMDPSAKKNPRARTAQVARTAPGAKKTPAARRPTTNPATVKGAPAAVKGKSAATRNALAATNAKPATAKGRSAARAPIAKG